VHAERHHLLQEPGCVKTVQEMLALLLAWTTYLYGVALQCTTRIGRRKSACLGGKRGFREPIAAVFSVAKSRDQVWSVSIQVGASDSNSLGGISYIPTKIGGA
jgi:hypothetical protein